MQLFTNILPIEELIEYLGKGKTGEGIELGKVTSHRPKAVRTFAELWCQKVDTVVNLDIEVNGSPSENAQYLMAHRGFTYEEFQDLFNPHIEAESEYPYYPVFNQLRKNKGGINTKKQRYTYLSRYQSNDEEDFVHAYLLEREHTKILSFFFGALDKLSVLLPLKKLKQHTILVAPSGSGKSELLRALFYRIQKKYSRFSLVMVDPHGDLARAIRDNRLTYKQRERLIYIDPFLADGYTPTFNPFDLKDQSEKTVQQGAEQFIEAFKEILTHEGGKPTETMISTLEKAVYFMLGRSDASLNTLLELFTPNSSLKEAASTFDPIFDDHFFKPGNRTRDGLFSRLSRLITNPTLKRVLGGHSTFDLEYGLNSGKIIVFDLSGFGEMAQVTFGKFLIASIKSYVRKRDKNTGIPIFCFVDESSSLVSGSFEYILSKLRGFGLHLVLATQFMAQYGDKIKDVKKNTAIKIAGGDVEEDVKEVFKVPKDFQLKDYHFALKVRGKELNTFKSPTFLLKNPKKYGLSAAQKTEMLVMQLDRYYKPIGQEEHQQRRDQSLPKQDRNGLPNPPFDLYLGDDD